MNRAGQFLIVWAMGLALAACGGGGSGGAGSGTTSGGGTGGGTSGASDGAGQVVAPITVGDSYTTSLVSFDNNTGQAMGQAVYGTDYISKVNADGSYVYEKVWTDGYSTRSQNEKSTDDQLLNEKHTDYSCDIQPPTFQAPRALSIGLTWNIAYTLTCRYNATGQIISQTFATNVGSVVSLDSITTPAGTFTAYKLVQVRTFKDPIGTTVQKETCWRDPQLRHDVACDKVVTNPGAPSLSNRWRLEAYSSAAVNSRVQMPATYGGKWTLSLSSASKLECGAIKVSKSGEITGDCFNAIPYPHGSAIPITGKVAVNGAVTAAIGGTIKVFGNLVTPGDGSGQWGDGSVTGTWQASHL